MTFLKGDRDVGRVITGSSNFTYSGLVDNLEFNVELKNRTDYEFARQKFGCSSANTLKINVACLRHGDSRSQNWNQPCPNTTCTYYGQKNQGNIRSIASDMTQSGKRRVFQCTTCGEQFSETRARVLFDVRTPEEKVLMSLKMLLVRVSLANISFVLGMIEETVLKWLERAARKAEDINTALLKALPVTTVQLDEMWSFVQRKVSAYAADGERQSPQDAEAGRQWV